MPIPREYLEAAYAKSTKNQPDELATEDTELLKVFIRAMRGLYSAAARVNPTFFAESASVAQAADSYPRPATAESVWRLEMPDGTKVNVVPFDDRSAASAPSVYRFGQAYHPVAGIASEDLTAFYAIRPLAPADLDTAIDPTWPESYDELLVGELALYLALKDGREEELAGLRADRDRWLSLFFAFLEHETTGEIRRYETPRFTHSEAIIPLSAILAAGTSLEL